MDDMNDIRDDLHKIKSHMNDHDLLIKAYAVLENVSAKIDNLEKTSTLKADRNHVYELEKRNAGGFSLISARIDQHDAELKDLRAYMNKVIGMGLAFNTFVIIIFGLLSFIKR